MAKADVLVITGYGTNCERETAHAARVAGADRVDVRFFSDFAAGKQDLDSHNFLIFPGGFLDGDDLGAAQAAALRWKHSAGARGAPLLDRLREFFERGGLILGICNGFQLLVKLGLLPALGGEYFRRSVSLARNDSARFEDRWVRLRVNADSPCVFTRGLDSLELPVRHGEGKLVAEDEKTLEEIVKAGLAPVSYADPATGDPTMEYPHNPNGSPLGVAGLTDPSGRVFGLMPHPEAYNHRTNHPRWTRGHGGTLGTAVLENGVKYLKGL